MKEKITQWLIFSVCLALMPLIFNFFQVLTSESKLVFWQLFEKGELLLVAAAISAACLGEVIGIQKLNRIASLLAGGAAVFVLLCASFYFASITNAIQNNDPNLNNEMISKMSLAIFIVSIITGGSCIFLGKDK